MNDEDCLNALLPLLVAWGVLGGCWYRDAVANCCCSDAMDLQQAPPLHACTTKPLVDYHPKSAYKRQSMHKSKIQTIACASLEAAVFVRSFTAVLRGRFWSEMGAHRSRCMRRCSMRRRAPSSWLLREISSSSLSRVVRSVSATSCVWRLVFLSSACSPAVPSP